MISAKTLVVDISNVRDKDELEIPDQFSGYVVGYGDRFLFASQGHPFNLPRGMVSLAEKFKLTETPARVDMRAEEFFGSINPSSIDSVRVYGSITKELVRCRVYGIMRTSAAAETLAAMSRLDQKASIADHLRRAYQRTTTDLESRRSLVTKRTAPPESRQEPEGCESPTKKLDLAVPSGTKLFLPSGTRLVVPTGLTVYTAKVDKINIELREDVFDDTEANDGRTRQIYIETYVPPPP